MSAGQAENRRNRPSVRPPSAAEKLRIPVSQRFGFLRPLIPDAENNKVRFVFAYDHRFMTAAAADNAEKTTAELPAQGRHLLFDCRRGAQIGNNAVGAEFNRQRGGVFAFKQRNFPAASIFRIILPRQSSGREADRMKHSTFFSSMQFSALSAVILRINLGISVLPLEK